MYKRKKISEFTTFPYDKFDIMTAGNESQLISIFISYYVEVVNWVGILPSG